MIADLKPDDSVAIQRNIDDVNLGISYDINSARNTHARVGSFLRLPFNFIHLIHLFGKFL